MKSGWDSVGSRGVFDITVVDLLAHKRRRNSVRLGMVLLCSFLLSWQKSFEGLNAHPSSRTASLKYLVSHIFSGVRTIQRAWTLSVRYEVQVKERQSCPWYLLDTK